MILVESNGGWEGDRFSTFTILGVIWEGDRTFY